MNAGIASNGPFGSPYACVFTSCAIYHTPFPILRLTKDDSEERPIVTAVMGGGLSSEVSSLINLDFGNDQRSAFSQLIAHGQQVTLPAHQLCLGLTSDISHSLCCTNLAERMSNSIAIKCSAFIFKFENSESPKIIGIIKNSLSCAFHRDGLWCLSQPEQEFEGCVSYISLNNISGFRGHKLSENISSDYSRNVVSPISVEAVKYDVASIFTEQGVMICDLRVKDLQWVYRMTDQLVSGAVCCGGEKIVLSSERDRAMVIDVRMAQHVLYEANLSFPVAWRSSREGDVAIAISRRQVGILNVEKLEFWGAFESSGGVLDATIIREDKHSVRVLSSSADGCLEDWSIEF
ncbi:uncharacterized protein TM35_000251080 [Trypanosoma theileri]|uniref:Uncharacterized protein n=1 Tax=Trypanosoma theileri TaxID=67003 RepID=A0A1X0NQ16_9TRYP|nr:uncharacterized protein TM35_000251080 [Trypanosoma theileri]ORC86812.1 hypothetical protein TM35_000251080 [Trypanosoma theileri]